MDKDTISRVALLGIALVILITLVAASPAFQSFTPIQNLRVSNETELLGPVTAEDSFTLTGNLTASSDFTLTDDLIVGGDAIYTPRSAITVSNSDTLAATGRLQPLTAAASVISVTITSGTAGQIVTFYNTSASYTIGISDTGNTVLSGDVVLGQYDTLTVFCDGTRCI